MVRDGHRATLLVPVATEGVMLDKAISILIATVTVIGLVALWRAPTENTSQPRVPLAAERRA